MKTPSQLTINRSRSRRGFVLVPSALCLAWLALSSLARATCQEGCLTDQNTVLGDDALLNNTGTFNTAIGSNALLNNTTGSYNTATGPNVLLHNTIGFYNTAAGHAALVANTTGSDNTAFGFETLLSNTTGTSNTAIGQLALWQNVGGSNNAALGNFALANNAKGNNNIAIGALSGGHVNTGSNNIDIGNIGVKGDSGNIRIGTTGTHKDTFIAGISGATVATGVAVLIDNTGRLGTTTSSKLFKEAITPMDKASEVILSLKPVTFRYQHELDPDGIPQFGLVAEQVAKVDPDLVARDETGRPYTVRYEAVNAMLLNEFLKAHHQLEEQTRQNADQTETIGQLKTALHEQQEAINALTARVEKVNAQVEADRPVQLVSQVP